MESIYKPKTEVPWLSTSTIVILVVVLCVGSVLGKRMPSNCCRISGVR